MSIQRDTQKIVEGFREQAPALYETWQQGIAKVEEFGLAERAPAIDATAPDFALKNLRDEMVSLASLLERGPVVLKLIRGSWCPFCSVEFAAWKAAVPRIRELGATFVMVTPEKDETASEAFRDQDFEVLLDGRHELANAYGVGFSIPEELLQVHDTFGLAPAEINADGQDELPSPALFVIDSAQKIRWRFVEADYSKRPEVEDALAALRLL